MIRTPHLRAIEKSVDQFLPTNSPYIPSNTSFLHRPLCYLGAKGGL